jgi:FkbM family methyltransferase
VHVGAHQGQEMPYYRAADVGRVTLVEPIPELAHQLHTRHPDVVVHQCACGSAAGRARLHLMQHTNLSTLQTPSSEDRVTGFLEVDVRRLDDLAPDADVAVIDVQGRELDVLEGAPWASLRLLIVETCTVPDPVMAADYGEVSLLAARHGFYEFGRWCRDYDQVNAWARGEGQAARSGEIRDVIFTRGDDL